MKTVIKITTFDYQSSGNFNFAGTYDVLTDDGDLFSSDNYNISGPISGVTTMECVPDWIKTLAGKLSEPEKVASDYSGITDCFNYRVNMDTRSIQAIPVHCLFADGAIIKVAKEDPVDVPVNSDTSALCKNGCAIVDATHTEEVIAHAGTLSTLQKAHNKAQELLTERRIAQTTAENTKDAAARDEILLRVDGLDSDIEKAKIECENAENKHEASVAALQNLS